MIITSAIPDDIPALSLLARTTFTHTFGHLYPQDQLAHHNEETCSIAYFTHAIKETSIYLAKHPDGTLLGYTKFGAVGLPVESISPQDRELHRLYVHPEHQRKAIGTALMDSTLSHPSMQQAPRIYIGVWKDNLIAQALYQRYGFTIIGEYDYIVGTQADCEYIMARETAPFNYITP